MSAAAVLLMLRGRREDEEDEEVPLKVKDVEAWLAYIAARLAATSGEATKVESKQ